MSVIIPVRKFEVEDFIAIDSGTSTITITIFQGKMATMSPGWADSMELTPDQAEAVARELISQANMVRKIK